MTDKKQIVKESTHWYAEDGTPVYEVPTAKGDAWRKTTLRDARQMQLAPGVTTIIRCAAAPARHPAPVPAAPAARWKASVNFNLHILRHKASMNAPIYMSRGTRLWCTPIYTS